MQLKSGASSQPFSEGEGQDLFEASLMTEKFKETMLSIRAIKTWEKLLFCFSESSFVSIFSSTGNENGNSHFRTFIQIEETYILASQRNSQSQ